MLRIHAESVARHRVAEAASGNEFGYRGTSMLEASSYSWIRCSSLALLSVATACGGIEPIESPYSGTYSPSNDDPTGFVEDEDDSLSTTTGAGPEVETFWDGESSSGGAELLCGNGVIEPGELCDGDELAGETCNSINGNFVAGELRCGPNCLWDAADCRLTEDVPDPPMGQIATDCIAPGDPILGSDGGIQSHMLTLDVPPGVQLQSVELTVQIAHPDISDLVIGIRNLISNQQTIVHQFGCPGASNLWGTYSDFAPTELDCENTNSAQVMRPPNAMPIGDAAGPWVLEIADMDEQDPSLLQVWCVNVTY